MEKPVQNFAVMWIYSPTPVIPVSWVRPVGLTAVENYGITDAILRVLRRFYYKSVSGVRPTAGLGHTAASCALKTVDEISPFITLIPLHCCPWRTSGLEHQVLVIRNGGPCSIRRAFRISSFCRITQSG